MQWLSSFAALAALIAIIMASFSLGKMHEQRDFENRLLDLEALASKIELDERLSEVEKALRGRCVGLPISTVCAEMRTFPSNKSQPKK